MHSYAVICRRRGFEMFFRRRKKNSKIPHIPAKIGGTGYDKNTIYLPRQDLPGMMKSLISSHKSRF